MKRDDIAAQSRADGGMFAVIPSVVMQDPELSLSAKMLYGIITWRCNDHAYCWATNRALGEILGLSAKRVSTLVSDLEARGHVETEILRDPETGAVRCRYIYPVVKSSRGIAPPIPKNEDTPPPDRGDTSPNSQAYPPPENAEDIYEKRKEETESEKGPLKSPLQGDKPDRRGRRREAKQAPDWKPERFEGFWRMYPLKKSKQAAIRAWDLLRPDDSLLAVMGKALQRQLAGEDWQRGFGIPYPATWLNGRRWEDEVSSPGGGRVVETEVTYEL